MLLVPTQFPHIQASASELKEMDALILPMHLALLATSVLLKASVVDAFLPDTQIAKCSIVQGKIPTAVKRWADHKSDNEVGNVNSMIVGENDGVTISDNKSAGGSGSCLHTINGIAYREVPMDLPIVGTVTILEATSESQEELVDMALLSEEEKEQLSKDASMEHRQELQKGDPYGAVLWPAAWAVAKHLLESTTQSPQFPLQGLSILELGTGTGLVSLAASLGGAEKVIASDYEDLALVLTRYAADKFHPTASPTIDTCLVDLCQYDSTPLPPADIVVAADVMYEPQTGAALAHRVMEALDRGSRVIIGDSPGRAGRPHFLKTLQSLGITDASFVESIGRTCTGPRHELICGDGSTSVSETPQDLTVAIMDISR